MVQKVKLEGYEAFCKYLDGLSSSKNVYLYFSGSLLPNGQSWCGDCVDAIPSITKSLESLPSDAVFVEVKVGQREFWKDRLCPFRTDKRTKLNVIPTLIKWTSPKRLEGEQCCDLELIKMVYEDDD